MTRLTQIALSLSIVAMFAMPIEISAQNRRNESRSENKTEQRSTSNSSSSSSRSNSSSTSRTRTSSSSNSRTSSSSNKVSTSRSSSNNRSRTTTTTAGTKVQDYGLKAEPQKNNTTTNKAATTTNNNNSSRRVTTSRTTTSSSSRSTSAGRPTTTTQNRRTTSTSSSSARTISSQDRNTNRAVERSGNRPTTVKNHAPAPRSNWERPYLRQEHRPTPSYRYGNHHFGYRLNAVPRGATIRVYNNVNYYYYDGIYYRPYRLGGYIVSRPPIGTYYSSTALNIALTIATINAYNNAARRIENAVALSRAYALYNTRYQVRDTDSYVTNIALQNNGSDYYYQDGVFYTLRNGQYYVIEPPIGALIEQLPEDYEEIVLDGQTYYQVENALYKVTVIDGALYFEVVCAL